MSILFHRIFLKAAKFNLLTIIVYIEYPTILEAEVFAFLPPPPAAFLEGTVMVPDDFGFNHPLNQSGFGSLVSNDICNENTA